MIGMGVILKIEINERMIRLIRQRIRIRMVYLVIEWMEHYRHI